MNNNEHVKTICTVADATQTIKRSKGKTLFISVGQVAPIKDDPSKCFPILGNVRVTKRLAINFLLDAYSPTLQIRGALVHMTFLGDCIFIGRAA